MTALSNFAQIWRDNPVLTKELRVRMRGARAYWILTGYLTFISFILFFQYTTWWNDAQQTGFAGSSKIGQQFFFAISIVQAFLVAFITPAVTSGAITIEKEQRTLEMLEMTRLTRFNIVSGKLISAVSFVALLLIASLPLTSICFFLGGVSPGEVTRSYLLLFAGSLLAGGIGLLWSTIARTTAAAVVYTYASILLPSLTVVVYLIILLNRVMIAGSIADELMTTTCAMGLFGINVGDGFVSQTMLSSFVRAWDRSHYFGMALPQWFVPLFSCTLVAALLISIATVRLETFPARKAWLPRTLLIAVFVQQLFFFFGARFFVYSASAPPGIAATLSNYPLLGMLAYPIIALALCIPVFTTGDLRNSEARSYGRWLLRGWSPRGMFGGSMNSGASFLCLLTLVIVGMYSLSFALCGHPQSILSGEIVMPRQRPAIPPPITSFRPNRTPVILPGVPNTVPPGSIVVTTPNGTMVTAPNGTIVTTPNGAIWWPGLAAPPGASPYAGGIVEMTITLLATVMGLSSLGMLFSVLTRSRWAALLLSYAFIIAIFILPPLQRMNFVNEPDNGPGFLINLYYLNPLLSLFEMTDNTGSFWRNMPLLFGQTPIWLITTTLYILLAVAAHLIMWFFVTRIASKPVLPYEDRQTA